MRRGERVRSSNADGAERLSSDRGASGRAVCRTCDLSDGATREKCIYQGTERNGPGIIKCTRDAAFGFVFVKLEVCVTKPNGRTRRPVVDLSTRSVPLRSQVNKLFTCRIASLTKLDHTRCACLRARAAGGQRRRSQVQRVLHTALPLAPLSLLSRSAPSAFDQRTRSPRRTSAAPLASRCCPRLTRRARAPCAHTC